MNGDGFDDIVIGETQGGLGSGSAGPGAAYVYFGGAGDFDAVVDGVLAGAVIEDEFGASVSGGDDLNGDGYDDVVVGAPGNDSGATNAGRVYVYFGSNAESFSNVPYGVLTGAAMFDRFGGEVAMVGDVQGDGYGDL